MSSVTEWLIIKVVDIISLIIPQLGISPELLAKFDTVIALFIQLVQGAAWFIPLDVVIMCFLTITVVDNWGIVVRVIKWIIGILPIT